MFFLVILNFRNITAYAIIGNFSLCVSPQAWTINTSFMGIIVVYKWRKIRVTLQLVCYTYGETILETRYSLLSLYEFLLTVLCLVCIVLLPCVYCFYIMCTVCIAVPYTLVAGLLARGQYPGGGTTGHLGTGIFSWFPCVYKQMLRWFPRLQVATACFSCSPPVFKF